MAPQPTCKFAECPEINRRHRVSMRPFFGAVRPFFAGTRAVALSAASALRLDCFAARHARDCIAVLAFWFALSYLHKYSPCCPRFAAGKNASAAPPGPRFSLCLGGSWLNAVGSWRFFDDVA
jgi:hypothetical protein